MKSRGCIPASDKRSRAGIELEIFAEATTWKAYFSSLVRPHIRGSVLEVGAGIGGTTPFLITPACTDWTCLEPDLALSDRLSRRLKDFRLGVFVELFRGSISELPTGRLFDSIVYIDVLEHIESDAAELRLAASRLRLGGALVVLAPAHQWLFSEFDAEIGHFRRYSKNSLRAIAPPGLTEAALFYIDCVGLLASAANRLILRQKMPTVRQIRTWDSVLTPLSRGLDPLLGRRMGKTVAAIWRN